MGEIKSTLDIIMEKTKGLTMTDEEKKAFKRKEVERKVKGLFQKFLDGSMNLEGLKEEIEAFGDEQYEVARQCVAEECVGRIDPGGENASFLNALETIGGVDTEPMGKILIEFQVDIAERQTEQEKLLRKSLKKQGISGSAVIPNIKADPEWIRYVSQTKERFHEKLNSLIRKAGV